MEIVAQKKNKLLIFVLSTALFGCLSYVIRFYNNNAHYEVQDWLINYQAGFVRRGLSGEFFLFLSNIFNVEVKLFYLIFVSAILIYFFYLIYNFIKDITFNLVNTIIIFCPFSILYNLFDSKSTGRKEIIVIVFLLFFINFIKKIKYKENSIYLLSFSFPILMLLHESVLFYLPYFFSIIFIYINDENKNKIFFLSFFFLIGISILTYILFTYGATVDQVKIICDSIKDSVRENCYTSGSVVELTRNLDIAYADVVARNINGIWKGFLKVTIISIIIGFLPIILVSFFMYNLNPNHPNSNIIIKTFNYNLFLFLPLLPTLPLYLFTIDWGRWVHTSYIMTMIVFIFYTKENFILPNLNYKSLKNLTNHINIHIKKFITILIIIIYCAGWYMPFCCNIYIKSPLLKFYKNTSRALNKSMTTDTVIDFFK